MTVDFEGNEYFSARSLRKREPSEQRFAVVIFVIRS